MRKADRIIAFVGEIRAWYARHKRNLPWRDLPDVDPNVRAYKVLVSEVMLQQTQVPRVIVKYKEFVQTFPHIEDLAAASNRDVLMVWRGMGYNSRALRLRDAAKYVVGLGDRARARTKFPGPNPSPIPSGIFFPSEMSDLLSIPGLGPYTAAAIRNFAWKIPTPCIDTNIRRVLHRTFFGPENADGTWDVDDKELLKLAGEILEAAVRYQITDYRSDISFLKSDFSAADWHAALMDFGSLVQTKRNPKWEICPLTEKGIMKTTPKIFQKMSASTTYSLQPTTSSEPGRLIAGRFTPNRIVRGRIVEALRDAPTGLTLGRIGKEVCIDWNAEEHMPWLQSLIKKLVQDGLLSTKGANVRLRD